MMSPKEKILSSYEQWQLEKFGCVLPEMDAPYRPQDEEEQHNADRIDEERIFNNDEENWHNEQIF